MRRALVVALATGGVAAAIAAASIPLPAKPQGSGKEPTAGGGTVAGKAFRARSAIVQQDSGSGDVYIYVFKKSVGCHVVSYADAPYVWTWVHTNGTPLDVGRPMRTSGTSRFIQVSFVLPTHYIAVQPGVGLFLSRVDTHKTGVWHGGLRVKKQTVKGKTYAYDGTFAARWCGKS